MSLLALAWACTLRLWIHSSYAALKEGHSAVGGLNEQFAKVYIDRGGRDAIDSAMQSIQERIFKK